MIFFLIFLHFFVQKKYQKTPQNHNFAKTQKHGFRKFFLFVTPFFDIFF